ncbi:hypothetical protein [Saccharopolyspora sp. 5N708]|uniref:hypothetical protein n=1 Tax=Saccharopolyspora sp. 5N708 TaxID=3457424 RepID=UPI003FD287DF
MGARRRPNPLIKPNALGRTASAGLIGLVITASTFLGAGTANAADTLVVDQALATVEALPGQQIAVAPSTMDFKVREAVLLAMPLALGPADDAADRFAEQTPILIGSAAEGRTFYSGKDIAAAASPRLVELGLPVDRVDAVTWHFTNLVSLGNAVTVNAEKPAEQPPSSQPSPEQPEPTTPPQTSPAPPSASEAPPPSAPVIAPPTPLGGAPAAISVLPPDLRYPSGAALPWTQGRYGQVPGLTPNVGDLAAQAQVQQEERAQQDEIRAAGKAEAVPTEVTDRVAVPVLLAAISLAMATAALVRSWVLRRY